MNCKNCKKQGCSLSGRNHEMSFECKAYIGKTNADRIRAMTDEELAVEMYAKGGCPHDCETPDDMDTDCVQCWLGWLREEASE